eukprot:TRINITY_DN480_c0_g1_i1.p1 TRINITY_DN480_c0_g1~~TRINITY_DN480_c0_g1_i1.p1  ORF type:complete len:475 (+),score=54.77 TRINITY_DN480_c0_g1_i1:108-1532(+)
MGRRRRQNYKRKVLQSGEGEWEEREQQSAAATQLIAVSQQSSYIAIAFQSLLQIIQISEGRPNKSFENSEEVGCIRCLSFDNTGEYVVTGGDDKVLRIWQIQQQKQVDDISESVNQSQNLFQLVCVCKSKTKKKICAVVFSQCGKFVFVGDKFGDVYVTKVTQSENEGEASWVLGHYCAIIGDLDVSRDGRFLSSCDRDGKVRMNQVNSNPLDGDYEIQSYCLGHVGYVSQVKFLTELNNNESTILISAGQDGTLRTWNIEIGDQIDVVKLQNSKLLDANGSASSDMQTEQQSCKLLEEKNSESDQILEEKNSQDEDQDEENSISCISTYFDQDINQFVIAVVWRLQQTSKIDVAFCDTSGQIEQEVQSFEQIFEDGNVVNWAQFDSQGNLWILGSYIDVSSEQNKVKIQVVKGIWRNRELQLCDIRHDVRSQLLDQYEQQNLQAGSAMKKKKYSLEERELRKKNRNDIKIKTQ